MSTLAKFGSGVGRAAVAGFGLSAGRSAWKSTSKVSGLLLLIAIGLGLCFAVIALPFWGGRECTMGHRRSAIASFFLTLIVPVAAIASGFLAGCAVDALVQGMQGIQSETIEIRYVWVAGAVAVSAALGAIAGSAQRGRRMAEFQVEESNQQFLIHRGIREVFYDDNATHIDSDGNLLRFIDLTHDKITFLAVGRRNKRAYIRLSASGRMIAYSGVLTIGAAWDGRDKQETEAGVRSTSAGSGEGEDSYVGDQKAVANPSASSEWTYDVRNEAADRLPYSAQPKKPLPGLLFWPLAIVLGATCGFLGLVAWVYLAPEDVMSHPLSLLIPLLVASAVILTLAVTRQRTVSLWSSSIG